MANVLLAVFYMASIFGLVGLVLASRDKHPGITKVSPRYPITKAASSHFTAFQHPLDPELENAYPKSSSKKAEHMKEGHTHERWTEIPL
ncbi:uncharacterized protein F5147DRAFT_677057 [Suillus discolor]|uniref:Uncharacterized protein n=1 Tax=Suillus discolor TaxID=1912936 RepID=A0A9P7FDW0_9AGAM|nr:uncharacterized protein F5147DRAFT_677057 [Suillus discolor]KAG2115357.1 hypothetical protein F5147DRAFT_677057 [Suillus discolor]